MNKGEKGEMDYAALRGTPMPKAVLVIRTAHCGIRS